MEYESDSEDHEIDGVDAEMVIDATSSTMRSVKDKPWLVSELDELVYDNIMKLKYKHAWAAGYPGASSSLIAKQVWSSNVLEEGDDFERGRPHDPGDILKDVLYDSCPPKLALEFVIPRDRIADLQPEDVDKFMACSERRAAPGRANKSLSAWKAWLQLAEPGTAVEAELNDLALAKIEKQREGKFEDDSKGKGKRKGTKSKCDASSPSVRQDMVLLASAEVSREECTKEAVLGLAGRLGMCNAEMRAWCRNAAMMVSKGAGAQQRLLLGWRGDAFDAVRSRCGEMAHYSTASAAKASAAAPRATGRSKKTASKGGRRPGGSSFAMLVVSCTSNDECEGSGSASASASASAATKAAAEQQQVAFRRELSRLRKATGKCYLLHQIKSAGADGEDEDEDDEEDEDQGPPMTRANTHVLWLPECWAQVRSRVMEHCMNGEGEAWHVRDALQAGTTRTGNMKIHIFRQELVVAKKLLQGKGKAGSAEEVAALRYKLCTLLAITQAMAFDNYWTHDNEEPDEVAVLLADLAKTLKGILRRDNAELGLGVGADAECTDAQAHGPERSRATLYAVLDLWKARLLESEYSSHKGFNYQPPKKKRARDPLVPQPENQAAAKRQRASVAASRGEAKDDGRALAALAAWLKADVPKFSVKTALQLRCERAGDVRVLLVSPKSSFWKLSQFAAFAFGLSASAEYHSQKGSVLKGTTCTVRRPLEPGATGDVDVLICSKRAAGKRAFIVDKSVPAAAVFRCDPDSVTKPTWPRRGKPVVQSEADAATEVAFRFEGDARPVRVTLEAVGDVGKKQLPVAVMSSACSLTDAELDSLNESWLGDRQGPSLVFFRGESAADVNAAVWRVQRTPVLEL